MKKSKKLFKAIISAVLLDLLIIFILTIIYILVVGFMMQFEVPTLSKGEPHFFVCSNAPEYIDCKLSQLFGQFISTIPFLTFFNIARAFIPIANITYFSGSLWVFNYVLLFILTLSFYKNLDWFKHWAEKRSKSRKNRWQRRLKELKNFNLKTFYHQELKRLWPGN